MHCFGQVRCVEQNSARHFAMACLFLYFQRDDGILDGNGDVDSQVQL